MEIAANKGAIGFILAPALSAPAPSTSPAINVALSPDKTVAYSRAVVSKLDLVGRISYRMLQSMFMNSGFNLHEMLVSLKSGMPVSALLPNSLHAQYASIYTDFESYNVIGKIEGGDKVLKNEYVVHSAHLDHVGVGNPVNGDSIYNGAHDNASGVASLLEIGRLYKQLGYKPKRSILVLMVTAEEMGLLGSAYFANNPTVPKENIVANVNTDMPTLIAPLLSVAPLGAEHSSLEKNVAFACSQLGLEKQNDPLPDEVRFIRSDQYNFVLQGIPALHIKYGIKTNDPSIDLVKVIREWTTKHYHKPSDDISNTFDFDAAKKYVQLNFLISYSVSQTVERPRWNDGDFFGLRGRPLSASILTNE
jgi:Zn-dependent M28 family amino/carboxypeptidase